MNHILLYSFIRAQVSLIWCKQQTQNAAVENLSCVLCCSLVSVWGESSCLGHFGLVAPIVHESSTLIPVFSLTLRLWKGG